MMLSKGGKDFQNILLFKAPRQKKEMSNITNIVPQSKVNLPKVKQATRNKPKLGPTIKAEYNSVAMESIL
jgi:hypothetical protein